MKVLILGLGRQGRKRLGVARSEGHSVLTVDPNGSADFRELGEVPSGHLYARLADKITVAQYGQVIEILKRSGLVRESGAHLLTWIKE